jgi:hypothetical protein
MMTRITLKNLTAAQTLNSYAMAARRAVFALAA